MRLLRRTPPPGADDARALAAANRRILQLETTAVTMRYRLDRMAGQCAPPCPHRLRLTDAELAILRLLAERDEFRGRLDGVLAQLRALPAPDRP
jgi:hypothetical protein